MRFLCSIHAFSEKASDFKPGAKPCELTDILPHQTFCLSADVRRLLVQHRPPAFLELRCFSSLSQCLNAPKSFPHCPKQSRASTPSSVSDPEPANVQRRSASLNAIFMGSSMSPLPAAPESKCLFAGALPIPFFL